MRIGDKVICVDDNWNNKSRVHERWPERPVAGRLYVIRNVLPSPLSGEPSVLLIGLHNPNSSKYPWLERGFRACRFRLLDEMREEARERSRKGNSVELLNERHAQSLLTKTPAAACLNGEGAENQDLGEH